MPELSNDYIHIYRHTQHETKQGVWKDVKRFDRNIGVGEMNKLTEAVHELTIKKKFPRNCKHK